MPVPITEPAAMEVHLDRLLSAMQKPAPVTKIAIRRDASVRRESYVVGRADLKASIAMK
jgi:hypothetical protein